MYDKDGVAGYPGLLPGEDGTAAGPGAKGRFGLPQNSVGQTE
ncbi:hypothetical protein O9H85_14545 [Paenibacillus filicis]|uniref:Uncharacterized protein n=1 Tax=Paenibacillus gyeongsangnamensis TaxID=3388067 RepID=A0ABT4Q9R8_9BACL|nr:hypothetical protein [Paenibacillus filicis]MCZ8513633.1 hypothetical protein [Paenibacillus filicis]